MKLLTYESGNGPRCGVLHDDRVVDVANLIGAEQPIRDVRALLETGADAIEWVREALGKRADPDGLPLESVRLRSPVLVPPTVRDFIIFEEHATAQGTRQADEAWYRMPVFYFSSTLCIFGHDEEIPYPSTSQMLDYELELGCIIGKRGSSVREADALSYIAGFTLFNDWSARDVQNDEMRVGVGTTKGKDFASSLGPWMVTTDELAPLLRDGRLHVKCTARVNDEVWCMQSDAANAYYTWQSLVSRASWDSCIAPGDIIGSGTVGGGSIGEAIRKGQGSARYLQTGDVVEFDVECIGLLRNKVGRKPDALDYPYLPPGPPAALPERGSAKDYRYVRERR